MQLCMTPLLPCARDLCVLQKLMDLSFNMPISLEYRFHLHSETVAGLQGGSAAVGGM